MWNSLFCSPPCLLPLMWHTLPHRAASSASLDNPSHHGAKETMQNNGATGFDLFCTHLGLRPPYLSSSAKNKALPRQPFLYLTSGHSLSTEQLLLSKSLKKARAIDPAATNQTERLALENLKALPVQYFSGNSLEWTIVAFLSDVNGFHASIKSYTALSLPCPGLHAIRLLPPN